jgi:uncharacterized membrane protein YcaP (DUF421 family)
MLYRNMRRELLTEQELQAQIHTQRIDNLQHVAKPYIKSEGSMA